MESSDQQVQVTDNGAVNYVNTQALAHSRRPQKWFPRGNKNGTEMHPAILAARFAQEEQEAKRGRDVQAPVLPAHDLGATLAVKPISIELDTRLPSRTALPTHLEMAPSHEIHASPGMSLPS